MLSVVADFGASIFSDKPLEIVKAHYNNNLEMSGTRLFAYGISFLELGVLWQLNLCPINQHEDDRRQHGNMNKWTEGVLGYVGLPNYECYLLLFTLLHFLDEFIILIKKLM